MKTIEKLKLNNYNYFNVCLIVIAFIITALFIITGSYVHDKENIEIGVISPKRYVAPKDIEDVDATEKLKRQAMESVSPLYKHDTDIQKSTAADIEQFFENLDKTIANNADGSMTFNQEKALIIPVALNQTQYRLYSELTDTGKSEFKSDILVTTEYVYEQGLTEESKQKALELASEKINDTQWNDSLKSAGYLIISASIKPNLVLDNEAILAAKEQKANEVSPVLIRKNQKIVDEGELITEDIFNKLEKLNLINQDYKDSVLPIIGSLVTVLLLFFASSFYFLQFRKRMLTKTNEMLVLFTVYILNILVFRITSELTNFSIVPVYLFAMLVSILISIEAALVLNIFVCIVGLFIFNGNLYYLLYFLVTGSFAAIFIKYTKKRNHVLFVSLGIGLTNAISMFALGLFLENGYSIELLNNSLYSGIAGILTVIVVMGSLPFWEAVFEINTPFKLMDLTNPNNEIMRRIMIEAPGTYHHSLIVANLAETAAFDVEANAMLARVGAYYHDIGKLSYPLYFSENQVGENVHDRMEPSNSARIIIQHVKLGLEMADEYKLPNIIKNIIAEHHGTTFVKYFYYKAVKKYGKENINEEDFRYRGPIPQTKEAAIVMLADTVEAAVRSTISDGKDLNQVEIIISSLIKDKLDDGQLNECDVTIKELDIIKKSFLKVFQGMYHDRIAYPKEALEVTAQKSEENIEKLELEETENDSAD